MKRFSILVAILLIASSVVSQQTPAKKPATAAKPAATADHQAGNKPSDAQINTFLKQIYGYDEGRMSWKVLEITPSGAPDMSYVKVLLTTPDGQHALGFYVSPDGKHAIAGEMLDFPDPWGVTRDKLARGINGPERGNPGPVTIVEFGDLQCPACKAAQPTIEKLMQDEPNARLVFQQFPLPMHNWALKASQYADCIGRKNPQAFWKFVGSVYDNQASITPENADEKLKESATASGADAAATATCSAWPETYARVNHSIQLGKEVNVTGTPTLFINGRPVGNVGQTPYEVLKAYVDFAAKQP